MIMTLKAVTSSKCKICDDASDGFHFGTLACRACAAFFRRSTVAKRRYVCRYSGKCKIEKAARCMCRACRLEKCLALGMKPEHVQDQRGRIRSTECNRDVKEIADVEQKSVDFVEETEIPQPSSVDEKSEHLPQFLATSSTDIKEEATTSSKPQSVTVPVITSVRQYEEMPAIQIIEEAVIFVPENVPTLKKIYDDYREYKKFRKIATDVSNYYGCANNVKVLRELSLDDAIRLIRADVSVLSVFVNECVPGFKVLPETEKIALFKAFLKNFLMIDGSYWTAKYFPSSDDERTVIPFSGYVKFEALANLFVCADTNDCNDTSRMVKPLFEKYRKLLKESMVEVRVTEVELLALLSISLWDNNIESLSEMTKIWAQETRNVLLKELYNYCLFVDQRNAPTRYGTLLEYLKVVELIMVETEKNGIVFKILDTAIREAPELQVTAKT